MIDANFLQAASIAEKIAPYRHARLSAMKLVGDPNAPKDLEDSASFLSSFTWSAWHHCLISR